MNYFNTSNCIINNEIIYKLLNVIFFSATQIFQIDNHKTFIKTPPITFQPINNRKRRYFYEMIIHSYIELIVLVLTFYCNLCSY